MVKWGKFYILSRTKKILKFLFKKKALALRLKCSQCNSIQARVTCGCHRLNVNSGMFAVRERESFLKIFWIKCIWRTFILPFTHFEGWITLLEEWMGFRKEDSPFIHPFSIHPSQLFTLKKGDSPFKGRIKVRQIQLSRFSLKFYIKK